MVRVLSGGFYTSIQDLGRFDRQEYGVPYSGVMDNRAAKLANALLGNSPSAAVLEQTMTGATLRFDEASYIAITGADLQAKLNDSPVALNKMVFVPEGSLLSFGALKHGFRSYLAVLGGFDTSVVLGSRSMYKSITGEHVIKKGDVLPITKTDKEVSMPLAHVKVDTSYLNNQTIDVYPGPEFEYLTAGQQKDLITGDFHISKNNSRMAYQLEELFPNQLEPILTSGVFPGTVQLTPSGNLIILMKDCQTTGGYPRVLQLSPEAIAVLSQKFQGNSIKFKLLNI